MSQASLESTVYDLARQALGQQEATLNELRARTGILLTAGSLIATFLGGRAIAAQGLNIWTGPAMAAFGASVSLCVYVLLPKKGLRFVLDAPAAYRALYEFQDDEAEIDRRLAYWLQSFRAENHPTISHLTTMFTIAGIALLLEILLLATGLALS